MLPIKWVVAYSLFFQMLLTQMDWKQSLDTYLRLMKSYCLIRYVLMKSLGIRFARHFLITCSSHIIIALYVHSISRVSILLFKLQQFIWIYCNNLCKSNLDIRTHFSFSEHTMCLLPCMKENSHLSFLKLPCFSDLCQQWQSKWLYILIALG